MSEAPDSASADSSELKTRGSTIVLDAGESESDFLPMVDMPEWVAPALGFLLVLLSGLAVWIAVR